MIDYGKRFLIVMILAGCIGLLFVGGKMGHAQTAGKIASKTDQVWAVKIVWKLPQFQEDMIRPVNLSL
ncbi:hypothetical protein ELQ35_09890 [Peribacillus cavernae]|uniref:Uncharacterized protein n=1 Tax=Peribacillus cavernae TaxID=1674310 RepID=A0A433HLM2_9BACI|nr:hypothetical protein [Peribacillus cavernae]MDQ0219027.1 hypothetical protein [Peribacillus cavernae]RUQ29267.1 hypothetical protein ELQ35_09890 [Peribacillus cavernae]